MSPSRRPRWTASAVDGTLILGLLLLSLWLGGRVIEAVYHANPKIDHVSPQARPLVAWAWVAAAVQLASLTLYRRLPLVAWLVSSAMVIVHVVAIGRLASLAPHPVGFAPLVPSDAVALICLFTITSRRRLRIAVTALVATLAVAAFAAHSPLFGPRTITALLLAALAGTAFIAGLAARNRSAYLDSLLQRASDLDRARIREAELAVINERSRLAREIHDTVAHALSVIVVQAQGAAAAQARRPELTRTALTAIVDVGREALADMRVLLSTDPDSDSGGRAPLRGTSDVPALVQQLRDAGTAIDLDLPAHNGPLPPSLDHTLYRIVQESLTNAIRHTHADVRIIVRISTEPGYIGVDVHNSGTLRTPHAPDEVTAGHGLNGMRDRAAVLGGTVEAGLDTDGGFHVRARMPTVNTG